MKPEAIVASASGFAREIGSRMREALAQGTELNVQYKGRTDLVTEIDIWADKLIVDNVAKLAPNHLVIGEESSSELVAKSGKSLAELIASGPVWVVDPLDGTTNFVNGIPHAGVSIGYLEEGKRIAGVVYDPFRDELFHAIRGVGAFLNDRPISVSTEKEVIQSVIVTGFPYDRIIHWDRYKPAYEMFCKKARGVRRMGAATLDFCWTACGRFDGYFEYRLKPWDVAAGSLIAEEAGAKLGCFTSDDEYSINAESHLAAAPGIFDEMIALCREAEFGVEGK